MRKDHWKAFGPIWFAANQGIILFFLNAPVLKYWARWTMRIHRDLAWSEKIWQIQPNNYKVFLGVKNGKAFFRADFRTHWKFSKRMYHSLKPLWWTMHEWDAVVGWIDSIIPRLKLAPSYSFGFDTLTIYPDPHPEVTTVDGWVREYPVTMSWADIIAAAGNDHLDSGSNLGIHIQSRSTTDLWYALMRAIFLFDTSGLVGDTLVSATLSLYGYLKTDGGGWTPDINIYSSNPASNVALQDSDFATLGATAFCDNPVTYAGFSTSSYNDFLLNAAGLAAINLSGISKFGARNASYDVAAISPTWSASKTSYLYAYSADNTGTDKDPKLVVTYGAPPDEVLEIDAAADVSLLDQQVYKESPLVTGQAGVTIADTSDHEYPESDAVALTEIVDTQSYIEPPREIDAVGGIEVVDRQHYLDSLEIGARAIVKSKLITPAAPKLKGRSPQQGETAVPINKRVAFYLTGMEGDGVDINEVSVRINNVTYTKTDPEFHYAGTPEQYYIEVEHPDFNYGQAVEVEVTAKSLCGVSL